MTDQPPPAPEPHEIPEPPAPQPKDRTLLKLLAVGVLVVGSIGVILVVQSGSGSDSESADSASVPERTTTTLSDWGRAYQMCQETAEKVLRDMDESNGDQYYAYRQNGGVQDPDTQFFIRVWLDYQGRSLTQGNDQAAAMSFETIDEHCGTSATNAAAYASGDFHGWDDYDEDSAAEVFCARLEPLGEMVPETLDDIQDAFDSLHDVIPDEIAQPYDTFMARLDVASSESDLTEDSVAGAALTEISDYANTHCDF